MKTKKTVALFVLGLLLITMPLSAMALEPKLLWEKTVLFKIDGIKMASISGDVILYSQTARQIIMYDKNGHEIFHWGPRIDRQPIGVDISADGKVVLFQTTFTENYLLKRKKAGEWDHRAHYVTRGGKELWSKSINGTAQLSPDGTIVAKVPSGEEGRDIVMLDSHGTILWTYLFPKVNYFLISPDSGYFVVLPDVFSSNAGLHLFDKSGNLIWKNNNNDTAVWYISEGASYVVTDKRVYDKQGNIVLEGDAEVSGDGKKLMLEYPDKIKILNLPDKTVLREYPILGGFLSYDGRLAVTTGPTRPNNLLILDTVSSVSNEIPIEGKNKISNSSKDGKYLLVVVGEKKILFYQIYRRP